MHMYACGMFVFVFINCVTTASQKVSKLPKLPLLKSSQSFENNPELAVCFAIAENKPAPAINDLIKKNKIRVTWLSLSKIDFHWGFITTHSQNKTFGRTAHGLMRRKDNILDILKVLLDNKANPYEPYRENAHQKLSSFAQRTSTYPEIQEILENHALKNRLPVIKQKASLSVDYAHKSQQKYT